MPGSDANVPKHAKVKRGKRAKIGQMLTIFSPEISRKMQAGMRLNYFYLNLVSSTVFV
jgi:hypothetical protein